LTDAVTVIGAGEGTDAASNTILHGNAAGRVLTIDSGAGPVVLERLRITGGNSEGVSGISHGGTSLRMTDCTVSGNTSVDSSGGGILVTTSSMLEMTRCTVRDNRATSQTGVGTGGGIHSAGPATLTDCLIEANEAANSGGGLYVVGGTTTLRGTTQVRANAAPRGGGVAVTTGTNVSGALVIAGTCRVTENTAAAGQGGRIYRAGGTATLQGANPSPIVVNNCHENCVGAVPRCAATPVSC
jgi:parallel beta-helix repeat protein